MEEDELLDVVDLNDTFLYAISRNKEHKEGLPKGQSVRVINIFVINSKNQILVPIRSADRRIYPNCYDFSCGEHVFSGEPYDVAAVRGLKEELGIEAPLRKIGKLNPSDGTNTTMQIYLCRHDGPFDYDKKGIASLQWMTEDELRASDPKIWKGDLGPVLKKIQISSFI